MDNFINFVKEKIFFLMEWYIQQCNLPQSEKISYDDWEKTLKINFFNILSY